jgi:hypothetical protein
MFLDLIHTYIHTYIHMKIAFMISQYLCSLKFGINLLLTNEFGPGGCAAGREKQVCACAREVGWVEGLSLLFMYLHIYIRRLITCRRL